MGRLRTLLHNMKYLTKASIEDIQWNEIECIKQGIVFGSLLLPRQEKKLDILNAEESLAMILDTPKSFYRFGDGEIDIILGGAAGHQQYDEKLAKILLEALTTERDDVYVGINYEFFNFDLWNTNEFSNRFYILDGKKYRDFFTEKCHEKKTYFDAGFTQRYFYMSLAMKDRWYKNIRKLFQGKKVTVFMGEAPFKKLKYNVFDSADKVKYIYGPSKDAFFRYDELLNQARSVPKDELLCFVLGPTSKALVYELSKEGYLAYDIGHLPKDYDSYMRKIDINYENNMNFYLEDYKY